jgi:hypothetical protein
LIKDIDGYGILAKTLYLKDGTTPKVGFRAGKWLAGTEYEKVAVAKKDICFILIMTTMAGRSITNCFWISPRWPPPKKIYSIDNSKRTEQLLFRLDGVIDQELALVEQFFYRAGFNDAIKQ